MRKVDVSTKNVNRFAGKWVVIDPVKEKIIAVGETLAEVSPLVTHSTKEKIAPVGRMPFSFLVPRKDEGPYILWSPTGKARGTMITPLQGDIRRSRASSDEF